MSENNNKLFQEFPSVSTEDWKAKITADLKGADFDRKLVWRTNEGFAVQPFYRLEDVEKLDYLNTLPGQFPFVRGVKTNDNDWYVRQNITVQGTDYAAANKKALEVLNKGVTSLGFVFDSPCGESGFNVSDLDVLFKDICLEAIEVNFVPVCCGKGHAEALAAYVEKCSCDNAKVNASVTMDPLGKYLLRGALKGGLAEHIARVKYAIEKSASVANLRVIGINAKNFGNSGASVAQELGFALAQGAEYLDLLTDAGVKACDVAKNMKFNFSVSANYFMEIAKLRAGRMLWAQIVKAYTGEECTCAAMNAHAETGSYNKSVYDPYVNMLRTQTEAMSAALGGADSITVSPFNSIYEAPTALAERVARNQQLLLKEESHFDKIVDPSAGSYYIEELTASIVEEAWKLFLAIQEKGGFEAAAKEGFIQAEVKAMAAKRDMNIATRRENVLGTNQFPNFNEKVNATLPDAVFTPQDFTAEGAEIETLKPYRGAMAFENLRRATDKAAKRPLAFMLTIGNLNMRKARAQFAMNFFAVAGYEVKEGKGYNAVAEGIVDAKAAGAEIIVICSSDDEYATFAPEAFAAKDNAIFVVAGAPACTEELKAAGINNFIHVKSNLLGELTAYNKELGIDC
ncbi:MAG: methylmalonyl-CoA mutase family protein [Mangrovibacterium sp.]